MDTVSSDSFLDFHRTAPADASLESFAEWRRQTGRLMTDQDLEDFGDEGSRVRMAAEGLLGLSNMTPRRPNDSSEM